MLQEVSWEAAWECLLGIGIWLKMLQGKGAWRGEDAGGGMCIVGGWGLGAAGLQGSWDSPTAPLSPPYPSWDPTCPPGCSSSPGACCTAPHGTASA